MYAGPCEQSEASALLDPDLRAHSPSFRCSAACRGTDIDEMLKNTQG